MVSTTRLMLVMQWVDPGCILDLSGRSDLFHSLYTLSVARFYVDVDNNKEMAICYHLQAGSRAAPLDRSKSTI